LTQSIREADVAKLGGGFRWLTPLFRRVLYKPKEKDLLTGRRLQQLVRRHSRAITKPGDRLDVHLSLSDACITSRLEFRGQTELDNVGTFELPIELRGCGE
jgi:hypothetical protein